MPVAKLKEKEVEVLPGCLDCGDSKVWKETDEPCHSCAYWTTDEREDHKTANRIFSKVAPTDPYRELLIGLFMDSQFWFRLCQRRSQELEEALKRGNK